MKAIKRISTTITVLLMLLSFVTTAFAAELHDPIDCRGKDWDTIFQELLKQSKNDSRNIFAGYRNLVTGEEHFWQGDKTVITASMYKVPLNMMITEALVTGELDWEKRCKTPYEELRDATLIKSHNAEAKVLWETMGSYSDFKTRILPYIGADASEKQYNYYQDNEYSPEEIIHCLKTLYENPERFPGIIDTMKRATPERYFKYREQKYEIAQKYGFIKEWVPAMEQDLCYVNCCGICYTDEPIAIVMFTRGAYNAELLLTDYCTAMCDYAQLKTAEDRQRAEEAWNVLKQELEEKIPEDISSSAEPVLLTAEETAARKAGNTDSEGKTMVTVLCCAAVAVIALAAAVLIIAKRKATGIKPFWMIIAVAVSAFALVLCAVGVSAGTIYAKPDGDPGAVADEFLNALTKGNYTEAYSYLRDYSSLGLENEPQTEVGKVVYEALHRSYGYKINGACVVEKLEGRQNISFTYLDLAKTHDDITAMTMTKLAEIVKELPQNQIYDSNSQYKPEVANEAYLRAVKAVMENEAQYYTTVDMTLDLVYSGGRWQVLANSALLKALNGGMTN